MVTDYTNIMLVRLEGGRSNDAIYKFKRYEDASLSYAGIDKHAGDAVGLYNTVLNPDEYKQIFINS